MRSLRKWHQYIGLFFGPAIFFFALSGFLQVAGFHESHPGSTYQPAGWIVVLSSLHQHQRLAGGEHHDTDHHNSRPREPDHHMDAGHDGAFPLFKPFAVFTSWGLMLSSLLGMAIALTNPLSRRTSLIVILAGVVVPVALILI